MQIDAHGPAGQLRRERLSQSAADDPSWAEVATSGTPLLIPRGDRSHRTLLTCRNLRDAVLVPLRGEAGIVGTLLVGDRISDVRSFDSDDVRLLMTVADHAGLALRNGQLSSRLRHGFRPEPATREHLRTNQSPAMRMDVHEGITAGQFEVHVQPQASLHTGAVLGVQTLLRWRHPRHGLLFPDLFIPVAESQGLVPELTGLILNQAVAAREDWQRAGHQLQVSINLPARSTINDQLAADVQGLLERRGVQANSLTLEIAESAISRDPARAQPALKRSMHSA